MTKRHTPVYSNKVGKYASVHLSCIHYGDPRKSRSRNIRKVNVNNLFCRGCPFEIRISIKNSIATVTKFVNEHKNHDPATDKGPRLGKLSDEELKLIGPLVLESTLPPKALRNAISGRLGRDVDDVDNKVFQNLIRKFNSKSSEIGKASYNKFWKNEMLPGNRTEKVCDYH